MPDWKIKEAGTRFRELVQRAVDQGPQVITARGQKIAVLVSFTEYQQAARKPRHIVEAIEGSPLKGAEICVERSRETVSEITVGDE